MKKLNSFCGLSMFLMFSACSTPQVKAVPEPAPMMKCTAATDAERPVQLWSTAGFSAPESAVYDSAKKVFYVSNVVGSPVEKDGKGWISKLSSSGKMLKKKWVAGLNAPKGLGLRRGTLWIADIDSVVAVHIAGMKRTTEAQIPSSKFLNDITFGPKDEVFVSDMMTNQIYSLQKRNLYSVFAEGRELENPNGITVSGTQLIIAPWGNDIRNDFTTPVPGRILNLDLETKKITPWSDLPIGNLDGIELESEDSAIVSDWMAGKVYRIKKGGQCTVLLEGFKGSADLTFVAATRTLVIPLMGENRVVAYRLP